MKANRTRDPGLQRLIAKDAKGRLHYGVLQGETGKRVVSHTELAAVDSAILLEQRPGAELWDAYLRSDAILRACAIVGGSYAVVARVFELIPSAWRDLFYGRIAKARNRIGPKDSNPLPDQESGRLTL